MVEEATGGGLETVLLDETGVPVTKGVSQRGWIAGFIDENVSDCK